MSRHFGVRRKGRKPFFFEKKNQKTFAFRGSVLFQVARSCGTWEKIKSFLLLFFKKEVLACLPPKGKEIEWLFLW
jgi:hypothetical protein